MARKTKRLAVDTVGTATHRMVNEIAKRMKIDQAEARAALADFLSSDLLQKTLIDSCCKCYEAWRNDVMGKGGA